ncbi:MAG: DUF3786 domain-containing protein [Desulfobacter sp.]|nr:MAG: DUF3786 domain-containing protein [Desulfobacter sp.]
MAISSQVYQEHYRKYCRQLDTVDWKAAAPRLGLEFDGQTCQVRFLDRIYGVSSAGVFYKDGETADYITSVILFKYLLLCPERIHSDAEWCTFRDFKKQSAFNNVNYFQTDTLNRIVNRFSGRLDDLYAAGRAIGGYDASLDTSYDLSMAFDALPRIQLLMAFNDGDEEFPAYCQVFFQRQAEHYLDPESLAGTGARLAGRLVDIDKENKDA